MRHHRHRRKHYEQNNSSSSSDNSYDADAENVLRETMPTTLSHDPYSQNRNMLVNNITVSTKQEIEQKVKANCCDCFFSMFKK